MAKGLAEPNLENIELAILGEADLETAVVDDPEAAAKEMLYRILNADTEDELFEEDTTLSAADLLGVPLLIKSVRWQPSALEGNSKVFAVIGATRADDGGEVLITCGGRKVMGKLLRAGQLGKIPSTIPLKFTEAATASGRTVLNLVKA